MACRPALLVGATLILSTAFTLLLLEIALQCLPVRSYLPFVPVTGDDPVVRYQPLTEHTYSAGWNFDAYNKGRTNAQGYIADYDFDAESNQPLIAVVGDSFIESRMVPFPDTLQERLHTALKDKIRVYGVGVGGSPLSQYLIFARMMRDAYKPGMMIVNIVGNDFDESLPQYKSMNRFHYFVDDGSGALMPTLIGEYRPSWIKRLVSRSALVNYLYFHLNLLETIKPGIHAAAAASSTATQAMPEDTDRVTLSKKAVDAFLALLPEYAGLPKSRIVLIVDTPRDLIYTGTEEDASPRNYFSHLRHYLMSQARQSGYEIIDMDPIFRADYAQRKERFEFHYDAHWNSHAHALAAQAALESKTLARFEAALK